MHAKWMAAILALGIAGAAHAEGNRGVTVAAPNAEVSQPAQKMSFMPVVKGDPLAPGGQQGSSEATPYMAPSTGRWDLPGRTLPPPIVQNFRSIGVEKDD